MSCWRKCADGECFSEEIVKSRRKTLNTAKAGVQTGPMQYLPKVIENKSTGVIPSTGIEALDKILSTTYGAVIYQEQVQEIFKVLAGYSLGQADLVRRAMSKKKEKVLLAERAAFINGDPERNIAGCVANGISEEQANDIFDQMIDFARYAFNKAHAACYAETSYITGWLKYHYPAEYMAAVMNSTEFEKIPGLVVDLQDANIRCLRPDVNRSELDFSVDKATGNVRFGLAGIKGLGASASGVIEERQRGEYSSVADFVIRTLPSKKILENFTDSGAFDSLCENRTALNMQLPAYLRAISTLKTARKAIKANSLASSELMKKKLEESCKKEKDAEDMIRGIEIVPVAEDLRGNLEKEKALIGTYLSAHPLDLYPEASEIEGVTPIEEVAESGSYVTVYGIVGSFTPRFTKKDRKPMATFTLTDRTGIMKCVCFSKQFASLKNVLSEGAVLKISGKTSEDREDLQIQVDEAVTIEVKKNPITIYLQSLFDFIDHEKIFRRFITKDGDPLRYCEMIAPENGVRETELFVDRTAFTEYCRENGIVVV